jgi:hypothetical protein
VVIGGEPEQSRVSHTQCCANCIGAAFGRGDSTRRALRNDVSPQLEIAHAPLDELRSLALISRRPW